MDFLVEELETLQNYQTDSQVSILALAFANDLIILLADNHHDGQNLLAHKKSHLTKLGMKIAANKCTSFHINGRCFCGTQQPVFNHCSPCENITFTTSN
jgi:hypothetical protein